MAVMLSSCSLTEEDKQPLELAANDAVLDQELEVGFPVDGPLDVRNLPGLQYPDVMDVDAEPPAQGRDSPPSSPLSDPPSDAEKTYDPPEMTKKHGNGLRAIAPSRFYGSSTSKGKAKAQSPDADLGSTSMTIEVDDQPDQSAEIAASSAEPQRPQYVCMQYLQAYNASDES